MKKAFILLLICALFVTGCGKKEDNRVVIYTNIEENRSQLLQQRVKEKFPELDVVIQYMSTGNTAAKIKTEGVNVDADIVLGLETSYMESLKENFVVLNGLDGINDDHYLDGINPEDISISKLVDRVNITFGINILHLLQLTKNILMIEIGSILQVMKIC